MNKEIDVTNTEIEVNQQRELSYKGKLNRDLYLIGMAENDQVIGKIHWKHKNVTNYNDFITFCESHSGITKAIVSNGYSDWTVDIYTL